MAGRNAIAIDIGPRRLRALQGAVDRNRLKVRRVLVEALPDDVDTTDPRRLGAWVGRTLSAAGFPRTRAALAVAREHVVLKRMSLPTVDDRELPEMTRLAMQRELPFDADTAVIDFVCIERGETATTVLAVAAPDAVLSGLRQAARGAGLVVERLSLRSMGSAALCAGLAGDEGGGALGAILVVDITGERVDFSVVVDGVIRFSRAGELPPLEDAAGIARAVVTEARRTWMSYRIVEDTDDVRRGVVIGDRAVSGPVADSLREILKVPTSVFDAHPLIDTRAVGTDLGEAWSLAGLLLAEGLNADTIDLAHPRRAPDVTSRKRQLALAGLGAAAILGGAGITMARFQLEDLRDTAGALESQRIERRPAYYRYGRDLYKLNHLQQWESAAPDWLAHLAQVAAMAPPPDRLVLDDFSGSLSFGGVEFDKKTRRFRAEREIRIVLEGEAADRADADRFRGRLVETEAYEIATAGPDTQAGRRLPYSFQYNLRAESVQPEDDDADRPAAPQRTARLEAGP